MDVAQIFTEPAYGGHLQMITNEFWYGSGSRKGFNAKRLGGGLRSPRTFLVFSYISSEQTSVTKIIESDNENFRNR